MPGARSARIPWEVGAAAKGGGKVPPGGACILRALNISGPRASGAGRP
jgi:hypothetical protein